MGFNDIITGIKMVGYPIVVSVICFMLIYSLVKKYINLSEKNLKYIQKRSEDRESKLMKQIEEGQAINQKAIETLDGYSRRIDRIEDDIGNIKEGIHTINQKLG